MAKEITTITTLRITSIVKTDDNLDGIADKATFARNLTDVLKPYLGADDVVIDDVQDFEMDKE